MVFLSFASFSLHAPGWHLRCNLAKGLWLILLPRVSAPVWWHCGASVAHNTRTIGAPRPDCLLFCLSVTWCKLELMNFREELRQTNTVMSVSPVDLAVYYIYSGRAGGDLIPLTASKSSVILNIDWNTRSSVESQSFPWCVGCSVLGFYHEAKSSQIVNS